MADESMSCLKLRLMATALTYSAILNQSTSSESNETKNVRFAVQVLDAHRYNH